MLKEQKIEIKIGPQNKSHFNKAGYSCSVGDVIEVDVHDLPSGSNIMVKFSCDSCGEEIVKRYGRRSDNDICQPCSRKNVSTNFRTPVKYEPPPKEFLLEQLETKGVKKIANDHGVSIPVVKRWLNVYGIEIQPYHGKKFFKSEEEKISVVEQIRSMTDRTTSEISHAFSSYLKIIQLFCIFYLFLNKMS